MTLATNSETADALVASEGDSNGLVIDSAASHHMVNNKDCLFDIKKTKIKVNNGCNDCTMEAPMSGKANLVLPNGIKLHLKDVLFIPRLNRPLLSFNKLFNNFATMKKIDSGKINLLLDKSTHINVKVNNDLLELSSSEFEMQNPVSTYIAESKSINWHDRLGHPSKDYLLKLFHKACFDETCKVCCLSKMTKIPFKRHFKEVHGFLEAIHIYLISPFKTRSRSGFLYFMTIIDQFSGFIATLFIKEKGEVLIRFEEFIIAVEVCLKRKLIFLISDNALELKSKRLDEFCKRRGILTCSEHLTLPRITAWQREPIVIYLIRPDV